VNSTETVTDDITSLVLRWAGRVVLVVAIAGSVWWARTGADEYTGPPKSREEALARALGSSENVSASDRYVDGFWRRQDMVAPGFRSMRVVHELLLVNEVVEGPRWHLPGGCCYIDPAQLADPVIGAGALPAVFAEPERAGYRFEFIGRNATVAYQTTVTPYQSYVYIAWPQADGVGPYVFALHSDDKQVHYTTEWRVPSLLDPAVTDGVTPGESASADAQKPGLMSRLSAWGTRLRRRFWTSGNNVARAEERAIDDMRAFADAQNAFFLMLGARGYASVEALHNPGMLEGVPDMPALVGEDFTQVERDGYRYTFVGERLTEGGQPRLFQDFSYVAVPIGSGPPGRRSFAIHPDSVVRVRADGTAASLIDPPLGR
jgi:hypothetical protein